MIIPSQEDFIDKARNEGIVPVCGEIPYSPPYLLYEPLKDKKSFLLESIKGPEKIARYSFIGFDPCMEIRIKKGLIKIKSIHDMEIVSRQPLDILKTLMKKYRQIPHADLGPFQGGIVGILGYDFAHYFEKLPRKAVDDLDFPDAHFLMIDKLIVIDHIRQQSWIIICPGLPEAIDPAVSYREIDWNQKYAEAEVEIDQIRKMIKRHKPDICPNGSYERHGMQGRKIDVVHEMKKRVYMDIVRRAKEYIAAGDIFQANLSQRVSAYLNGRNTWELYRILRSINPSPFAAYCDFGEYTIVSSSPERLLRVRGRSVDTRPIAGTRPRGRNRIEDERMRTELLLNEKERAEHIMLIDLERNDLGRVSAYGSVTVDELMITEDYSHVIHIVSNVLGTLSKSKDCYDAVKAAFPGGTITGVPKVRCMQIIDELEPVRRGFYTGSIGYFSFSGDMDLNIVIRTFVIKDDIAYVQAGAGIVADSDPEKEYFETLKKAEALIKSLEKV